MSKGIFYARVKGTTEDLRWLKDNGFDFVIGGADPSLAAEAARQGLEFWACMHTFPSTAAQKAEHCRGLDGKPHLWFNSGCPNHPEVRRRSLAAYRKAAAIPQVAVVMMDGVRFASPASGLHAFFTCFCSRCNETAAHMGFDIARIRRDVSHLYEHLKTGRLPIEQVLPGNPASLIGRLANLPGVIEWLSFRARVVENFVAQVARTVHAAGKRLGGFVFSPSLAPLVGQDYLALSRHFDVFSPMLYPNCRERNSIAPVNTEIESLLSWTSTPGLAALHWTRDFFGLPTNNLKTATDLLIRGLPPVAMEVETARARTLIGTERYLAPIIWHDDHAIRRTADCVTRGGADGWSVFLLTESLMRRLTV